MTTFMRQLRAFADSFDLTVLVSFLHCSDFVFFRVPMSRALRSIQVINSTTRVAPRRPDATNPEAVFETTRKPALGPSFTFTADATLWLSRRATQNDFEEGEEDAGITYVAEVFRSRITVRRDPLCDGKFVEGMCSARRRGRGSRDRLLVGV